MNICIFGDSITWGAWDTEMGGWVNRLRVVFDIEDWDWNVYNQGISGETTEDVLKRFMSECEARAHNEPVKIIFAIGTNDSGELRKEKRNRIPINDFKGNIRQLIEEAKKFTKDIAFVGLTPANENLTTPVPWYTNLSYTNKSLREYDAAIRDICKAEGLLYIPLYDQLNDGDLYDGIHPNIQGHKKIFEKIKTEIINAWRL